MPLRSLSPTLRKCNPVKWLAAVNLPLSVNALPASNPFSSYGAQEDADDEVKRNIGIPHPPRHRSPNNPYTPPGAGTGVDFAGFPGSGSGYPARTTPYPSDALLQSNYVAKHHHKKGIGKLVRAGAALGTGLVSPAGTGVATAVAEDATFGQLIENGVDETISDIGKLFGFVEENSSAVPSFVPDPFLVGVELNPGPNQRRKSRKKQPKGSAKNVTIITDSGPRRGTNSNVGYTTYDPGRIYHAITGRGRSGRLATTKFSGRCSIGRITGVYNLTTPDVKISGMAGGSDYIMSINPAYLCNASFPTTPATACPLNRTAISFMKYRLLSGKVQYMPDVVITDPASITYGFTSTVGTSVGPSVRDKINELAASRSNMAGVPSEMDITPFLDTTRWWTVEAGASSSILLADKHQGCFVVSGLPANVPNLNADRTLGDLYFEYTYEFLESGPQDLFNAPTLVPHYTSSHFDMWFDSKEGTDFVIQKTADALRNFVKDQTIELQKKQDRMLTSIDLEDSKSESFHNVTPEQKTRVIQSSLADSLRNSLLSVFKP